MEDCQRDEGKMAGWVVMLETNARWYALQLLATGKRI